MNQKADPINPRKQYYSSLVTGKRIPVIWAPSSNRDRNGDKIVEATERGMLYWERGPNKEKDFTPLVENTTVVMKMAIIIMAITIGAARSIFKGTFGCKGTYIETTWLWASQFVIFLVILINIWIINAEGAGASTEATWTGWSILGAFLTWVLLNIVAKIGDTWLFFDVPFWPGPMTYWGAVMLLGTIIYAISLQRDYWIKTIDQNNQYLADKKVRMYTILESIIVTLFLSITFWRFGIELLKEMNKRKDKFNFIDFFLGFDKKDKDVAIDTMTYRDQGRCKNDVIKKLKKEIKEGIKNSPWHKFRMKYLW